mmetsp:Transcript_48595/g.141556  ORF Transcript_48595/g.141556 Transcript_48595/m.141556 type:complete len:281 (+) Transcript_48595:1639-2481(+)
MDLRHGDPGQLALLPRAPQALGPAGDDHPKGRQGLHRAADIAEAPRRGDDPAPLRGRQHTESVATYVQGCGQNAIAHPRLLGTPPRQKAPRFHDEDGVGHPMWRPRHDREAQSTRAARGEANAAGTREGRHRHPARLPRPQGPAAFRRAPGAVLAGLRGIQGGLEVAGHGPAGCGHKARGHYACREARPDEQGRDVHAEDLVGAKDAQAVPAVIAGVRGSRAARRDDAATRAGLPREVKNVAGGNPHGRAAVGRARNPAELARVPWPHQVRGQIRGGVAP